jgi:hypothetical protein
MTNERSETSGAKSGGETVIRREMFEKHYGDLKIGDCAWFAGALIRVEKISLSERNRSVRDFYGTVIRECGPYSLGEKTAFSGLAHCPVLTEVLPAESA